MTDDGWRDAQLLAKYAKGAIVQLAVTNLLINRALATSPTPDSDFFRYFEFPNHCQSVLMGVEKHTQGPHQRKRSAKLGAGCGRLMRGLRWAGVSPAGETRDSRRNSFGPSVAAATPTTNW